MSSWTYSCQMTLPPEHFFGPPRKCCRDAKFVTKHFLGGRISKKNFYLCGLHARALQRTNARLLKEYGGIRAEIKPL